MIIKNRIKFVLTIGAGLFLFSGLSQPAEVLFSGLSQPAGVLFQEAYQHVFAGTPVATYSTFIEAIISTLSAILTVHIATKDTVWVRVWPYLHYLGFHQHTDRPIRLHHYHKNAG